MALLTTSLLVGAFVYVTQRKSAGPAVVRYESVEKTYEYVFSDGVSEHGAIAPPKASPSRQAAFEERLGDELRDCSDEGYRCLAYGHSVLAVPRGPLSVGTTYIAGGANLTIEKCLRGTDRRCQAALVVSECQVMLKYEGCAPFGAQPQGQVQRSPVTWFVYDADHGVTAFGSGGGLPDRAEDRAAVGMDVVSQNKLQGADGLLKADVGASRRSP